MAKQTVTVPDIGGGEAEVIELLVAVGDQVEVEQGLIVLESDKASMEIPSSVAGTVVELLVTEGQQLAEGAAVAVVDGAGEAAAEEPAAEAAAEPEATPDTAGEEAAAGPEAVPPAAASEPPPAPEPAPVTPAAGPAIVEEGADSASVYAGPAVRKLAREFGIPLEQVEGTGPRGRLLKEDLHGFVKRRLQSPVTAATAGGTLPVVPEIDFSAFGEVEVVPRSKLDKLTAANMQRSWLNVPHVTQYDDADITELESFRAGLKGEAEQRGTRLTPLPFLLKAVAVALRDNPKFRSSLADGGENLVYKQYTHLGMAVDTPAGLMVPVIRDVDKKSIWELAAEVLDMADKARERKLKPAEMQGGCFTISSLGNIGGTGFTPIVNTPEVGILGVSRARMQPVWDGEAFAPRKMLPLSLSYDHRVINGGDAGRFLTQLVSLLGDIRQLIL